MHHQVPPDNKVGKRQRAQAAVGARAPRGDQEDEVDQKNIDRSGMAKQEDARSRDDK